jgi:biotin carboxyl carrier protein
VKYFVEVNKDTTFELEVDELPDGRFRVRGQGVEHVVDYLETTAHEASIVIGGRSKTFWFSEAAGATQVSDGRDSFAVNAMDERTKLEASIFGAKIGRGGGDVRSIMPGIVTRVLVKEGDAVVAGAPLLCIEAMKMENEIKSEAAGVVRKVFVGPGKTVQTGEPLVELG